MAFNATLLILFLSFIVFMLAMRALFFAPLARIKRERDEMLALANTARGDAEAKMAQLEADYKAELEKARRDAANALQAQLTAARNQAAEAMAAQRESAQQDIEKAQAKLLKEREKVLQQLLDGETRQQLVVEVCNRVTSTATVYMAADEAADAEEEEAANV